MLHLAHRLAHSKILLRFMAADRVSVERAVASAGGEAGLLRLPPYDGHVLFRRDGRHDGRGLGRTGSAVWVSNEARKVLGDGLSLTPTES